MPQLQTKRKEQADILQRAGEYLRRGLETARSGFVAGQRAQEALGQGQLEQTGKVLGTGVDRVEAARQLTNVMDKWSRGEATSEEKRGIIDAYMHHAALIGGGTVYHGTPHEWAGNQPDISKVGTGQGAQSYGHGLYFAEARQTAESYSPAFSGRAEHAQKMLKNIAEREQAGGENPADLARVKQYWQDEITKQKTASLYRADIPDEHIAKMLDWDKPLSEQPEVAKVVREKFGSMMQRPGGYNLLDLQDPSRMKGSDLYKWLSNMEINYKEHGWPGQSGASDMLKEAGIPGIKYLDQGSRAAGQGIAGMGVKQWAAQHGISEEDAMKGLGLTRNFVVFDPAIVSKVEKVK